VQTGGEEEERRVARSLKRRRDHDHEAVAPKLEEVMAVVRIAVRKRRRDRHQSRRGTARHDQCGEAKEGSWQGRRKILGEKYRDEAGGGGRYLWCSKLSTTVLKYNHY
jgi:hypothetical protein